MSALLMNRDGFVMPADGWYQMAPLGEFDHAAAGVVQVLDREACEAMANTFAQAAAVPNFAGLLVDFDHFSLDGEKRSEAAGWITALENREGSGLWAKIRWSDLGEAAVKGGRYRFLSPVWARADCVELGNGRVRPVRLLNAAVTNDPNLKGMRPLSNRSAELEEGATTKDTNGTKDEKRYKWVLGDKPEHCPSCAAAAGQVHTMAEWTGAGVTPGAAGLYCTEHCGCRLVETDEAAGGDLGNVSVRKEKDVANAGELANIGWRDEARAASLRVRQAASKAERRKREAAAFKAKHGREPSTDEEWAMAAVLERDTRARAAFGNRTSAGWQDAARAASLAVRRARAEQRRAESAAEAARGEADAEARMSAAEAGADAYEAAADAAVAAERFRGLWGRDPENGFERWLGSTYNEAQSPTAAEVAERKREAIARGDAAREGNREGHWATMREKLRAAYHGKFGADPDGEEQWAAAAELAGMQAGAARYGGEMGPLPKARHAPEPAVLQDERWAEAMATGLDDAVGDQHVGDKGAEIGRAARARVRGLVSEAELQRRAKDSPNGTRDPRAAGIKPWDGGVVKAPREESGLRMEELSGEEWGHREDLSMEAFGISYESLMTKRDALEEMKEMERDYGLELVGPMGQEFLDTARIIEGGVPESMVGGPGEKTRGEKVMDAIKGAIEAPFTRGDRPGDRLGPRTAEDLAFEKDRLRRVAEADAADARWKREMGLGNRWSDAARAASIRVRKARAAERAAARARRAANEEDTRATLEDRDENSSGDGDPEFQRQERESMDELDRERAEDERRETEGRDAVRRGGFRPDGVYDPSREVGGNDGNPLDSGEEGDALDAEGSAADALSGFEEEGFAAMPPEDVLTLTENLRAKLAAKKPLEPAEEGFLQELADAGYAGDDEGDPIFNWIEGQGAAMGNRWSDAARAASLAVRRARAGAKTKPRGMPATGVPPEEDEADGEPDGAGIYLGGSPYFDEATGKYVRPAKPGAPLQPGDPGWFPPRPWFPKRPVRPGVPGAPPPVPVIPVPRPPANDPVIPAPGTRRPWQPTRRFY